MRSRALIPPLSRRTLDAQFHRDDPVGRRRGHGSAVQLRGLETHGFGVISAGSGHEAIDLAHHRGDTIHLLMTDVMMPEMNGGQVAEILLARQPSLRVLFMSGYAEDVLASHVGLLPGAAFLSKPFKPKALVTKVREVLDSPLGNGAPSDHPVT